MLAFLLEEATHLEQDSLRLSAVYRGNKLS